MSDNDNYRREISLNDRSFYVSTDASLIDLGTLNAALESPRMHWARGMSVPELQNMIRNSVFFGIYEQSSNSGSKKNTMIGFARLVTDKTTFVYLTDVWVSETQTGNGLGSWLIDCVNEWVGKVPYLRQFTLITRPSNEPYYTRKLGMGRMEAMPGVVALVRKGKAASNS